MSVLLLRLAGPLQAWGDSSRYARRTTRPEPTKSGVLGLLAAAQGRRRSDALEDLAALSFGVRVDQPGRLIRDFQTAHRPDGTAMPLSYRYYLSDALFVAAVAGPEGFVQTLHEALLAPVYPLYLGRRACPPAHPLVLGIRPGDLEQALQTEPWQAPPWYRRDQAATIDLPIVRDALTADEAGELVQDVPVSFNPVRREHSWRTVVRSAARLDNPDHRRQKDPPRRRRPHHDPMAAFGGS